MKNYDIEKLITLAFTDGYLNDKEYEIIKAKAAKIGFDTAELEIILNAKLQQIAQSKPRPTDKCPSCGETVTADDLFCPSCDSRLPDYYDEDLMSEDENKDDESFRKTKKKKKKKNNSSVGSGYPEAYNDDEEEDNENNTDNVDPVKSAAYSRKSAAIDVANFYENLSNFDGNYILLRSVWRCILLISTFGLYGIYKTFIQKKPVFDIKRVSVDKSFVNDAVRRLEYSFDNSPIFIPLKHKLTKETNKAGFRIQARTVVSSFFTLAVLIFMVVSGKRLIGMIDNVQRDSGLTRSEERRLTEKYNLLQGEKNFMFYKALDSKKPSEVLKQYNLLPETDDKKDLLALVKMAQADSLYHAGKHVEALEQINFIARNDEHRINSQLEEMFNTYLKTVVTDLLKQKEFNKAKDYADFSGLDIRLDLTNEIEKAIILDKFKGKK